jgi:hypothetical protein
MTFRRYSKLTSSSAFFSLGVSGAFPSADEREFRGESSSRKGKLGEDEEAPFGLPAIRGEVADQ